MIQKLRRQSVKASGIKGKLGLGSKPNTYRSRSFIVPSPTPEHHLESPEDINTEINSANSASYESSPRSGPSRYAFMSSILDNSLKYFSLKQFDLFKVIFT